MELSRLRWDVRVLLPNGWFPPVFWRLAPAWRAARRRRVPSSWRPDGVTVSDLFHQNRVPSRLSRPLDGGERIGNALAAALVTSRAADNHDLVLCQFALPYGPSVAAACRRIGLRYAVYLRGDDVWVWPHDRPERLADLVRTLAGASLVLAVSQAILTEARRLAGAPLARAAVVPNGIDLEHFRPVDTGERLAARRALNVAEDATVIVCVGAALARKGWRELLRALGGLRVRNVVLLAVVSGLGADLDLTGEREALAPDVTVIFLHDVRGQEMPRCYAASDIFCLPTYGEGMSNALIEAMASGLPVVTTPVGGHREVITHGIEGYLIQPREVEVLRQTLGSLVADATSRKRLGAAAGGRGETSGKKTPPPPPPP
ncbi:MAG: glycosyltransferase, partial [Gemmatimonadaceae bacterium]